MSRSWLVGLALSLCTLSTATLTFVTLEEAGAAAAVKCLFAEVTPGQGAISGTSIGTFSDSWVYDVYGSTAGCASNNIKIDVEEVTNINMAAPTVASPSSFNMCATGGGVNDMVHDGYRIVSVSGGLDCVHLDGKFDATIWADETVDIILSDASIAEVDVDAYDPETGCP